MNEHQTRVRSIKHNKGTLKDSESKEYIILFDGHKKKVLTTLPIYYSYFPEIKQNDK